MGSVIAFCCCTDRKRERELHTYTYNIDDFHSQYQPGSIAIVSEGQGPMGEGLDP
jgi:hypothetical protein